MGSTWDIEWGIREKVINRAFSTTTICNFNLNFVQSIFACGINRNEKKKKRKSPPNFCGNHFLYKFA